MALNVELEKLWESLSCCNYRGDQHTHILIEENDPLAKLKKVTLEAPNGNWFSFNPDKGRGPKSIMSPLLKVDSKHDHHKACDCVIFVFRDGKLIVLYIDLKSSNPSGYSAQFRSTRQFVRYTLGLLEEFHGHSLDLLEERYVILYGGKPLPINKTTTVPHTKGAGKTEPDKPHKREVSNPCHLHLKELLS